MTARRAAWIGPLLLLSAGSAMLTWTWRAWPDPIVDFGRELYVPWRLAQGDALYTDVAWFNGPLSQHWNALLFRAFGAGFSVIVWSNVAVLLATVAMLHALIARLAGRVAAAAAGMIFLLVFACGQYVGIGNYNWIAPYSHELTHGLALAVAVLFALERWSRGGSTTALALAGLAAGLCFLTKVETFLAAAAASAVMLAPAVRRRDLRALGTFAAAGALPVLASVLLVGGRGTLGAWPSVLGGEVSELPFYRAGMGLDRPGERALELMLAAGVWLLALAPAAAASWFGRNSRGPLLPAGVAAAEIALFALLRERIPWENALRPLPLFVALTVAGLALARRGSEHPARWSAALALAVLALVPLSKMILLARVAHYGFALALPGTLVVAAALVGWLPTWLDRRGARGDVLRVGALALLAVFALEHVLLTREWLGRKTEVVGAGRDAFRSDVRGAFVNDALARVASSGAASLAVLPEGIGINYLARIPNPTPYINFMPPEEILFGDRAWTEAFRSSPPDVILIVSKDTSEYGRGSFGQGYGRGLAAWVQSSYRPVGAIRREGVPFEIRILARGQEQGQ